NGPRGRLRAIAPTCHLGFAPHDKYENASGDSAIDDGVFYEAQDRESALERRALDRARAKDVAAGALSRIRSETQRDRTGRAARAGEASRSRRAAPAFAGHGRVLRPDLLNR